MLITDHNVRETLDIVDRACIIYDGQVLFAGSPEDLVADENVRRLYLGESFSCESAALASPCVPRSGPLLGAAGRSGPRARERG